MAAVLTIGATTVLSSAASGPTVPPAWQFTVRVTGIPVSDAAGRAMQAPFLGGLEVPRPQLVDINGDGKPELFVQERSGELMMFERVAGVWVWRSDRFQDLNIGEWYRFVDIDRDGRIDLFSEMLTGYMRAWRNEGSTTEPKFVALGDTIRDVDGRAILADRQNIINAVDIDCNAKLDLFIGRVQGVVDRFEQEGHSPDGSPRFRLIEEQWQGIEVLGPEVNAIPPASNEMADREGDAGSPSPGTSVARRHGANTLTFADITGKGVLDLFWGDFFEEGLLRFENTGSCAEPDLTGKPTRFPPGQPVLTSGYNAPAFGDVDGDGNIDLVLGVIGGAFQPRRTSIENLFLLRQAPKGSWSVTTKRVLTMIDVGSEAAPAIADLNGDGLLDLIIGSKVAVDDANTGTLAWFENVGTATRPSFRERALLPIRGEYNYAPTLVDLDGDALLDLVVGTWRDRIQWYRNSGTRSAPAWTLADSALVMITRGTNTTPSFGDLDGDGLLDLVIGEASGTINLYRNIGSRTSPRFELVSDQFQDIKVRRRSAPALADMDGDRKLDLLIGSDDGQIELWRGVGGARAIRFERDPSFSVKSYPYAMPAVGDIHGTGKLDLFVGVGAGGIRWHENGTSR
jgi:hypothetical protein